MSVARVLNQAADIIEKKGWCQFRFSNFLGCVCLSEALTQSTLGIRDYYDARNAVTKHLRIASLTCWNDEQGRTKEQVVQMLRDVAATADA